MDTRLFYKTEERTAVIPDVSETLSRFFKLTTIVFLVSAISSGNAATISGTVIDSYTEKPIVSAKVLLRNKAAASIDSGKSDNYGHYAIKNVPAGSYSLVASATAEYLLDTVKITVGTKSVSADIMLIVSETSTRRSSVSNAGSPEIVVLKTGLILRNFNEKGMISIYSVSGKLLYRNELAANTGSLYLPQYINAQGVYLVKINLKGISFRQKIFL